MSSVVNIRNNFEVYHLLIFILSVSVLTIHDFPYQFAIFLMIFRISKGPTISWFEN